MRRTIRVSTSWCLTACLLLAAGQTVSADDAQEAELRKQAEAAKVQQTAAQKAAAGVRQKAKALAGSLSKLKADVNKAQSALKAATAKLKTQQEAATKAAAAKAAQDKVNANAAKLAKDADAAAKAALAKSQAAAAAAKAAQVKAVAAAKALTDSQAAVKVTQTDMATAKKTIDGGPAATKQAESQIAAFQVEVKQAEDQLAAATKFAIEKQKGLEHVLTEAGKFVSFSDTIAPILAKRCLACHNARTAKGRLNLETYAALMKGGESGEVVDPGEGDFSSLFAMVEDGSMPEGADPLTKEQIASIKKWIDTGA